MSDQGKGLWGSTAEAEVLAGRAESFWNLDYFDRIVLPLLGLPPGAKVLDAGAGNGALTFLLARLRPDLELTGVDLTTEMVEAGNAEAAKRGLANVRFSQGDAQQLSLGDATFDAAVCQTLLGHLPEPGAAVREMSRILKSGGTFMAAEFHILNLEWPVDSASTPAADPSQGARYTNLLVEGYRRSGQGDLRVGARVPFLAAAAGLEVLDCRINDRIAHAFAPFRKPSERASMEEARGWVALFEDAGYRAWVEGAMTAAGGTAEDVEDFLRLLPAHSREGFRGGDYSFVWLLNPVLVVTIARKPAAAGSGA